jgi:glycerol uptake facilitator-like aquaporin
MKPFLTGICFAVLTLMLYMLYMTITASLHQDIVTASRELLPDAWFQAILADVYCGFLFFWLWVAWRERSSARVGLWFVLIMTFGNIASAGYVLLQLRHLRPGDDVGLLLCRRKDLSP